MRWRHSLESSGTADFRSRTLISRGRRTRGGVVSDRRWRRIFRSRVLVPRNLGIATILFPLGLGLDTHGLDEDGDGSSDFAEVFEGTVVFVADAGFHVGEVVFLADLDELFGVAGEVELEGVADGTASVVVVSGDLEVDAVGARGEGEFCVDAAAGLEAGD